MGKIDATNLLENTCFLCNMVLRGASDNPNRQKTVAHIVGNLKPQIHEIGMTIDDIDIFNLCKYTMSLINKL